MKTVAEIKAYTDANVRQKTEPSSITKEAVSQILDWLSERTVPTWQETLDNGNLLNKDDVVYGKGKYLHLYSAADGQTTKWWELNMDADAATMGAKHWIVPNTKSGNGFLQIFDNYDVPESVVVGYQEATEPSHAVQNFNGMRVDKDGAHFITGDKSAPRISFTVVNDTGDIIAPALANETNNPIKVIGSDDTGLLKLMDVPRFGIEDNVSGGVTRTMDMQNHGFFVTNALSSYIGSNTSAMHVDSDGSLSLDTGMEEANGALLRVSPLQIYVRIITPDDTFEQYFSKGSGFIPLSVNGVFADENGNIALDTGDGSGGRFGIEDSTSTQNRVMHMPAWNFELQAGNNWIYAGDGVDYAGAEAELYMYAGYVGLYAQQDENNYGDVSVGYNVVIDRNFWIDADNHIYSRIQVGTDRIEFNVYNAVSGVTTITTLSLNNNDIFIPHLADADISFCLAVDADGKLVKRTMTGGGGSTPDLQAVTDVDNKTTNPVIVWDGSLSKVTLQVVSNGGEMELRTDTADSHVTKYKGDGIYHGYTSTETALLFPTLGVPHYIPLAVNGVFADSTGGIINTLQNVTNEGNTTSNSIIIQVSTTGMFSVENYGNSANARIATASPNGGYLQLTNTGGFSAQVWANYLTSSQQFYFPRIGGMLAISVNGNAADVNGNITVSTGGVYTVSNGLTESPSGNFKLGGTLAASTVINTGIYKVDFSGSVDVMSISMSGTSNALVISAANGNALVATGTSIFLNNATAITASSTIITQSTPVARFTHTATSTSNLATVLVVSLNPSGAGANGIGGKIEFQNKTTTTGQIVANYIASKWTDATHASRTSQFIISGVNNAVTADLFTLSGNGALKLNNYGVNTFTGTAAKWLAVDSSGNLIEMAAPSGGGSTYTASNGLTMTSNDVKLGGTLTADTNIAKAGFALNIIGDGGFLARAQSGVNQGSVAVSTIGVTTQYANTTTGLVTSAGFNSTSAYMNFQGASGSNIVNTITANSSGFSLLTNLATTGGEGMYIANGGALRLNKYGAGTFTGTAAKWLAVDSSGNLIEMAAPSGGGGSVGSLQAVTDVGNSTNNHIIAQGFCVSLGAPIVFNLSPGGTLISDGYGAQINFNIPTGELGLSPGFASGVAGDSVSYYTPFALTIKPTGNLVFGRYGSGTITGTATYGLAVDTDGKLIEVALGGGGGNLEAVTGSGNSTTHGIVVTGGGIILNDGTNLRVNSSFYASYCELGIGGTDGYLKLANDTTDAIISATNLSGGVLRDLKIPDASGTFAVSLNGIFAGTNGDISEPFQALTAGSTVNWDNTISHNAKFTIANNLTTINPTGDGDGQQGQLLITQDGTGSRKLVIPSGDILADGINVVGTTDTIDLPDAAGAKALISYINYGTHRIWFKQNLL